MTSKRQQGIALISVLLVVAILLAVASRLMTGHNVVINQHQNVFEQNQALQYVLGAETLAMEALRLDFEGLPGQEGGNASDHLGEQWAQALPPFELDEGGFLEAQLRDLNNCYNANSVLDPPSVVPGRGGAGTGGDDNRDPRAAGGSGSSPASHFRTYLSALSLLPEIADEWLSWVDVDDLNGRGEDADYALSQPPHRTPNIPVTDVSEFALLASVEQEDLAVLRNTVCLLPDTGLRINLNTAPLEVLVAYATAQNQSRGQGQLSNLGLLESFASEERAYGPDEPLPQDIAQMFPSPVFTSNYFEMHATAQVGSSSVTLRSVLYRNQSSGEITVLQRDFGKLFRSRLTVEIEEA